MAYVQYTSTTDNCRSDDSSGRPSWSLQFPSVTCRFPLVSATGFPKRKERQAPELQLFTNNPGPLECSRTQPPESLNPHPSYNRASVPVLPVRGYISLSLWLHSPTPHDKRVIIDE